MTPDEFRSEVLPQILTAWERGCFCPAPGFRKLVSFDFRDYAIGPVGLADSEILIDSIIRQQFTTLSQLDDSEVSEISTTYQCPNCGATCTEIYAEFSISMYRSTVRFDGGSPAADEGLYLVGFYGFNREEFARIDDFRRTESVEEFVRFVSGQET